MSRSRMAVLSALAAAGLFGAHVIDYLLVVPDPGHRHDLLLRTGHGYLSVVLAAAVAAAVVALLTRTAAGLSRVEQGSIKRDASVLAMTQIGAFVALESIERIVNGVPADARLWRVLGLGILLQGLVALIAASVLRASERLAIALRTRVHTPEPRGSYGHRVVRPTARVTVVRYARLQPRAPPSLSAA